MASSSLRALISCSYCFRRSWEGGGWKVEREGGRVLMLEGATLLLVRYIRIGVLPGGRGVCSAQVHSRHTSSEWQTSVWRSA